MESGGQGSRAWAWWQNQGHGQTWQSDGMKESGPEVSSASASSARRSLTSTDPSLNRIPEAVVFPLPDSFASCLRGLAVSRLHGVTLRSRRAIECPGRLRSAGEGRCAAWSGWPHAPPHTTCSIQTHAHNPKHVHTLPSSTGQAHGARHAGRHATSGRAGEVLETAF